MVGVFVGVGVPTGGVWVRSGLCFTGVGRFFCVGEGADVGVSCRHGSVSGAILTSGRVWTMCLPLSLARNICAAELFNLVTGAGCTTGVLVASSRVQSIGHRFEQQRGKFVDNLPRTNFK